MRSIKSIAIILIVVMASVITVSSYATAEDRYMSAYPYSRGDSNGMKTIFMDTFYGMAAGALIATAISSTQSSPNWGKNIGTGAAIGGIAGAAFGVITEMHYLSSVENGKVYVGIPTIGVTTDKTVKPVEKDVMYTAGLFRYKF
ncbi:MAG: hypothetical protein HZA08_04330 [Nitrospirae bacterium]|nr:hypothetical protein [Nitrospirota bacterium]